MRIWCKVDIYTYIYLLLLEVNTFRNTEKYYYKEGFDKFFPNCEYIVLYFWMPKYTDATDPSARTLTFYEKKD